MTTEQTPLPITAMLEEKLKDVNGYYYCEGKPDMEIMLEDLITQVRAKEEAQQKKAKEEERERIVSMLMAIVDETKKSIEQAESDFEEYDNPEDSDLAEGLMISLLVQQEAITRIRNI